MSKLAIVYYSETNNTKAAAEAVAAKTEAKIVRVKAAGNTNPMKGMLKIASKPVGEPEKEVEGCDRIVLMSPIYAWSGIPSILGFLKAADLSGKEVMIVTSGADPEPKTGMKVAAQYQKHIEKAGGKVTASLYHQGGDYKKFAGEEEITNRMAPIFDQIVAWASK